MCLNTKHINPMSYLDYLPRELSNELQRYRESAITFGIIKNTSRDYYIEDLTFTIQHSEIIVPCIYFNRDEYYGFRNREYWGLPSTFGHSRYRINRVTERTQIEIRSSSQLIGRIGSPWIELLFSKLEHEFPELNT